MIAVAILAGGQSRRMGTDKAALRLGQSTLLERTAHLARTLSTNVLVVGRERPYDWPQVLREVRFIRDEHPDCGPLGGLQSAFVNLDKAHHKVLLLACDLPRLNQSALHWLVEMDTAQAGSHGTIVKNAEQLEPLFAVYHREVAPLVEAQMESGRRSMHALIASGDFAIAEAPDWLQPLLSNLNTPNDWQRIESRHETRDRRHET